MRRSCSLREVGGVEVPEADCGEGTEAEEKGVEVGPVVRLGEDGRASANVDYHDHQTEGHRDRPVFPVVAVMSPWTLLE